MCIRDRAGIFGVRIPLGLLKVCMYAAERVFLASVVGCFLRFETQRQVFARKMDLDMKRIFWSWRRPLFCGLAVPVPSPISFVPRRRSPHACSRSSSLVFSESYDIQKYALLDVSQFLSLLQNFWLSSSQRSPSGGLPPSISHHTPCDASWA